MSLQHGLLFLHILGVVMWMGAGATLSLLGLRVRRSIEPAVVDAFIKTMRELGIRLFMPSLVLVLLTGVAMVFTNARWRISEPWILIGLALFLIAFLTGAVYLSGISIALGRLPAASDRALREAQTLIGRWLRGYGLILVVLVLAVWDMVFKPFR